jgi:hypothetical protein
MKINYFETFHKLIEVLKERVEKEKHQKETHLETQINSNNEPPSESLNS